MVFTAREDAIKAIAETPAATPCTEPDRGYIQRSDMFGRDVFNMRAMRERLPKGVFQRLEQTVKNGERLNPSDADVVASAMKDWAMERGATHYTHWFQPMTGTTAEKHDTFLTPTSDGQVISQFSGDMLIQGQPDASSFPSGGLRSTFEARGYTSWDPTSPAFLISGPLGRTLYIPTVFYSYTGESLDRKTPLLRSENALSNQCVRLMRLLGNTSVTGVQVMIGAEQEYFLVDRRLFMLRPDLVLTGRTLYGAKPLKGQELEDHYFGAIPSRVMAFMQNAEEQLFALGIPVLTRHNEVAPGQFEIAPVYEQGNIACDHNMLIMEVLRTTAERHGFACLFHEKPFIGVNGSGKHNNWSLRDSGGHNLLEPGDTPRENAQFLLFLAAVLRAVHNHPEALRIGTVGASNDHRLGAHEAPPAILSVYLGEQLTSIIKTIAGDTTTASTWGNRTMEIGVSVLPPLPKDVSDRNRTSPMAFTGNRFEFRAVGASQSIAPINIALNAAVTLALDDISERLEAALAEGTPLIKAVQDLLASLFKEHEPIIFNGNNYSKEWQEEAERRGLPNLRDTVLGLRDYNRPDVMKVFCHHGILSERELLARQGILIENYVRTISIEAQIALSIGRTSILPAVLSWQKELAEVIASTKAILPKDAPMPELASFNRMRTHALSLSAGLDELEKVWTELQTISDPWKAAEFARDKVLTQMNICRKEADILEELIDNNRWRLPSYEELLWLN